MAPVVLALLTACATEQQQVVAVAEEVCELVPSLDIDAAGLALARPLVVPGEVKLWEERLPTRGYAAAGPEGVGVIRAAAQCRVARAEGESEVPGRWVVTFEREEPDLTRLATWEVTAVQDLPRRVREVRLEVDRVDGELRVTTLLAVARVRYERFAERLGLGEFDAARELLRELEATFPDPLLHWDHLALEEAVAHPPTPPGTFELTLPPPALKRQPAPHFQPLDPPVPLPPRPGPQ